MLQQLNLPKYSFKFKELGQRMQIFDAIRKKYIVLSPEEWVRQNFIQYLIQEKKYPTSLISIEMGLKYNNMRKRGDVVIYDNFGKPLLIVECKAPGINITQDTFDQIARYNMVLKVKYLVVSNGLIHYCCRMNYDQPSYTFVQEVPFYLDAI